MERRAKEGKGSQAKLAALFVLIPLNVSSSLMRLPLIIAFASALLGVLGQPSAFSSGIPTEIVTTITATATATATTAATTTATATSSPLFVITAFPTPTSTQTLTATATSLYMITSWPTPTSAFNSTPTSTPFFYLTPYPSYDPTNGTTVIPSYITDLLNKAPPGAATILGGVAVGLVGIGAVVYAIRYLRNGGTVKGLFQKAMANRGKLAGLAKSVPLSPEMRKALEMANQGADRAAAVADNPAALLNQLPVGDSFKENLKKMVPKGNVYDLMEAAQNPAEMRAKALEHFRSVAPEGAGALVDHLPVDAEMKKKIQALAQKQLTGFAPAVNVTVTDAAADAVADADVVLQVKTEDLAEVQAMLAAKRLAGATGAQNVE